MKVVIPLCVLLAISRFFITSQPLSIPGSYAAVAHLFVGGLIGAAFVAENKWKYIWLAIGLSIVEVVAFVNSMDPLVLIK